MGCHKNITHDKFPKQGKKLNQRVNVCFHYDTSHTLPATVVRDDVEEPYLTVLKLDDGRHVLSTECQFNMPSESHQMPQNRRK